jgi:hypothetical protein
VHVAILVEQQQRVEVEARDVPDLDVLEVAGALLEVVKTQQVVDPVVEQAAQRLQLLRELVEADIVVGTEADLERIRVVLEEDALDVAITGQRLERERIAHVPGQREPHALEVGLALVEIECPVRIVLRLAAAVVTRDIAQHVVRVVTGSTGHLAELVEEIRRERRAVVPAHRDATGRLALLGEIVVATRVLDEAILLALEERDLGRQTADLRQVEHAQAAQAAFTADADLLLETELSRSASC